jgi:hypothetical protein
MPWFAPASSFSPSLRHPEAVKWSEDTNTQACLLRIPQATSGAAMIEQAYSKELKSEDRAGAVRTAAFAGLLASAICLGWLYLNTHYLRHDNWTSVFYTGARMPMPVELANENIYLYPGVVGYDAQFYHLIAHDPLFRKGFARFIDDPRFRYRRILVPGLAVLLSFGRSDWVDPAYIAVVLGFVFLGTFWLTRWSMSHGLSPAWGLLFLVVPASLVTMLLMIVDGALAALTVGAIWYAERNNKVSLLVVLACAALVRESGVLLIAGYCVWLLVQRRPRLALGFGMAAVPLFLWLRFVQLHTGGDAKAMISVVPFAGLYGAVVGHWTYQQPILLVLDFVAMGGMLLAFGFAVYYLWRRETRSPAAFMVAGFLLLGIFVSDAAAVWPEVNSFGRVFTPVLLFVAMTGLLRGNWWTLAPIALVDLRIGAIFLYHAGAIARAIVAGRP